MVAKEIDENFDYELTEQNVLIHFAHSDEVAKICFRGKDIAISLGF